MCRRRKLHTISVEVDLPHYVATIGEFEEVKIQKDAYFEKLIREAEELAKTSGIKLTSHVVAGHAVVPLRICNEDGFDAIVVGFTGHSRIYERIWGGTSRNIARFAPCTVIIVK